MGDSVASMARISGPAVQALREQAGLSARELARRVSVDHSTIRRVERGATRTHVRVSGLEHLLAGALGVDVTAITVPDGPRPPLSPPAGAGLSFDPAVTCEWDDKCPCDCGECSVHCTEPSRFQVVRSDHDGTWHANGHATESCERHLAPIVACLMGGDGKVHAEVTMRWD